MTTTLQERVQQAVDAGFTISQLAKAAGVTNSAASQWLSGLTKSLKAPSAIGLAELTNWNATWWTSGQGPRERGGGPAPAGAPQPVRRMLFRRGLQTESDTPPPTFTRSDEVAMAALEIEERFSNTLPAELQRNTFEARIQVGGMSRNYDYVSQRHVLEMVVVTGAQTSRARFEPAMVRLAVGRSLDDSRIYMLAIVPIDESIVLPFSLLHSLTVDANLLGVKIVLAAVPEQVSEYLTRLEMTPAKEIIEGFNDLNPATYGDEDQI